MNIWYPQTKILAPGMREVIERPHLFRALRQGIAGNRLSLISAPAGSGKTTLVSAYLAANQLPAAWLSLDELDNDPNTFISAFIGALQKVDADCAVTAENILHTQQEPDLKRLMTAIINDLMKLDQVLIVLDDMHVLKNAELLRAIDFLIDHISNQIHVILITRVDPPVSLARWRARGELNELRLEGLNFTVDEIGHVINDQFQLHLDDAALTQIHELTGGWAAGVRLIGLSLSRIDPEGHTEYIRQITAHNRHVFDLLADEVLNQESSGIRQFLLQTSILNELSPAVCNAVTGRNDARSMLDELYRRNLFIRVVDVQHDVYRYHDLFREFLRRQVNIEMPDLLPELHRRAASAHPLRSRQIEHYIAANDWHKAVPLIGKAGKELIDYGNFSAVEGWLKILPEVEMDRHGWLLYLRGTLAYHRGKYDEALRLLELAEARFHEDGDSTGVFEAIMMHNAANQTDEALETQLKYIERVRPYVSDDIQHLYVELLLSWAYLVNGQPKSSKQHFEAAFDIIQRMPDRIGSMSYQIAGPIVLVFDDLNVLQYRLEHMLQAAESKNLVLSAALQDALSHAALWKGDIHAAQEHLNACVLQWDVLGGATRLHAEFIMWQRMVVAWLQGSLHEVERVVADAANMDGQMRHIEAQYARIMWCRNDLRPARAFISRMTALDEISPQDTARALYLSVAALLSITDDTFPQLELELLRAVRNQRGGQFFFSHILYDMRITLAYCYLKCDLLAQARDQIRAVLLEYGETMPGRVAREGAFVEPLLSLVTDDPACNGAVKKVRAVLSRSDEPQPIAVEDTGETLTAREVEVLQLIVAGASNQGIADELVIGISTVKTHVSRILQKLNVSSRTHAASVARERYFF